MAAKDNIIDHVDLWFEFVDYRNQTMHVYNPIIAEEIYSHLPTFRKLTTELIAKLQSGEFK